MTDATGLAYQFPEFHKLARRANWKIMLLDSIAKHLGVSIHIEGVPWGAPGNYRGVMSDTEIAKQRKKIKP